MPLPSFAIPRSVKYQPVRQLAKAFDGLREELAYALVFSSVATQDIVTHWSDLDVLVVVKNDALFDARRFRDLRAKLLAAEDYLYQFDPWQHHGIQYLTETDLRFYSEAWLPAAALRQGASLLRETTLTLSVRESAAEQVAALYRVAGVLAEAAKAGELQHHCKGGVCLQENFTQAEDNFYQLKYFLSAVLLLPSLFLAAVGMPVYKRESFEKIQEYFTEEELELVRACERVRKLFTSLRAKKNGIPIEVRAVLGRDYLRRAGQLGKRITRQYEIYQRATTTR